MGAAYAWWQTGVVYQIYPRSFRDSNGDGVGDLEGITSRLDYVQGLHVDAVWISPFYPSPMRDFGYDVTDYTGVHPLFGTLADFDRLVGAAHRRGLRVILDLVPSHTSDLHPWFLDSRSSRRSARRDWYLWRDPQPGGGPPNNWLSMFGGSAWQWDEATGQYYCHTFLAEQPDLNWRHPGVRAALRDAMRFWLDRGVDGFRLDVVYALAKDELLRDDPPNPGYRPGRDNPYEALRHVYSLQRPESHEVLRELRRLVDGYGGRVLIGETFHLATLAEFVSYYGAQLDECHLPFNFQLIVRPWEARGVRRFVEQYEAALPPGAWPNWVLGNHDQPRLATRVGQEQARVAQMLLLTLRGTPTCYYGDELGMTDVPIPSGREQDPYGKRVPGQGRDPQRTPMQWDAGPHAGFSAGEPWLPVAADAGRVNVAVQDRDRASLLALFRALTGLRRATPALTVGAYASVEAGHADVFAYLRQHEGARFLVALNFGAGRRDLDLGGLGARCRVALSTHLDRTGEHDLRGLSLRPNEGLVASL